jgi:hypothetical protein
MTIQVIQISDNTLTVKQLKDALAKYPESDLVTSVAELKPNGDHLGIITFLLSDLSMIEGLFEHIGYFNKNKKWLPVPVEAPKPIYSARITTDVLVRNESGASTNELIKAGSVVDVYAENVKAGEYTNRLVISPPNQPHRNIWKNNTVKI